ncbi:MAG: YcxB family protein [Erysipelotrichales bacterium]|nr:YcxB family protein [Erysipelotrichales bacterium]
MEYTFETSYTAKTMTLMARALRKTIRKKHSQRSHIFGGIVMLMGILLIFTKDTFNFQTFLSVLAVLMILVTLLFEDHMNGYIAKKRLLPGTEKATTVFTEEGFMTTTSIGTTNWKYDKILQIAELNDHIVFIFSASHAQLYDKRTLQGGSIEDYRSFIETVTGKRIEYIK